MEAAVEVASNLREDDYREVFEGHGHFPLFQIPMAAFNGDAVWFEVPNGKTAGLAGVHSIHTLPPSFTPAIPAVLPLGTSNQTVSPTKAARGRWRSGKCG